MNLKKLLFASVIVLSANASFAQSLTATDDSRVAAHLVTISIPQVALLDLEASLGATDITLTGTAPTEAGSPMTFGDAATKSTIWMNYSSIVKGELSRNVTVVLSGVVPLGLKLSVLASAASTDGKGTLGTASSELTLTTAPQSIVTGIGSTYTGDGVGKGRNLTYKLGYADTEATDYAKLRFDTVAPLTITYTLSDM